MFSIFRKKEVTRDMIREEITKTYGTGNTLKEEMLKMGQLYKEKYEGAMSEIVYEDRKRILKLIEEIGVNHNIKKEVINILQDAVDIGKKKVRE